MRGHRVMLDRDLAELYGVHTKALNQAVKRNNDRFPEDFTFKLTMEEAALILASRSQIVTLNRGQNVKYAPHVFTEHGAVMLANSSRVRWPSEQASRWYPLSSDSVRCLRQTRLWRAKWKHWNEKWANTTAISKVSSRC
jgi:ORF6N domain